LPEIERENILAGRLEEMQKFKDAMQLDMMYKMAGAGGDDEDEDDDGEPSRKRSESCHPPLVPVPLQRNVLTGSLTRRETHQRDERGFEGYEGLEK
jgi:hypothetical protein